MRQPRELPTNAQIPAIGDRIEMIRTGVSQEGTVHYADWMQVLVKWDDGSSSSLRIDRDAFRIIAEPERLGDSAA